MDKENARSPSARNLLEGREKASPTITGFPNPESKRKCDSDCCSDATEAEKASKRPTKRREVLSWDDYFMSIAYLSAYRSKDPSTQVGACIVNKDNRVVGIGYNGMPRGCSDDDLPWCREGEHDLDSKYLVQTTKAY